MALPEGVDLYAEVAHARVITPARPLGVIAVARADAPPDWGGSARVLVAWVELGEDGTLGLWGRGLDGRPVPLAPVSIWRASGQSQSRFALEHGAAQSSFAKWVALYKPAPMALPTFATVEVVDEALPPAPNLLVHLGSTGLHVEVPPGFDIAELRRLVGALC